MARRRKRDPEDPQQHSLYAWQNEIQKRWPDSFELTVSECRALIDRVYARCGLEGMQPPVTGASDKCKACYSPLGHAIQLPRRWARNRYVVLHETAHSLLPETVECHGPEFASLVVQLWSEHIPSFDALAARRLAREMPEPVSFAFELDSGGDQASSTPSRLAREVLPSVLLFLYVSYQQRAPWRESTVATLRRGRGSLRSSRHPFVEAQIELL